MAPPSYGRTPPAPRRAGTALAALALDGLKVVRVAVPTDAVLEVVISPAVPPLV